MLRLPRGKKKKTLKKFLKISKDAIKSHFYISQLEKFGNWSPLACPPQINFPSYQNDLFRTET